MATLDKVTQLLCEQLGISADKVKEDSKIVEDLGADSIDVFEMVMALEDELGIEIEEDKTYIVVNKNDECKLIIINMKNFYFENDKFYFQENTDEGESFQVDEYIDTIKLDNYNYDTSKLLVLKDNVSNEDYDKASSNQNILLIKNVNKGIFDNL